MLYSRIVPEPVVEIPNRPAFRASEVCELAQIPPYVLKSWEKEFPGLGVSLKPGAPRVYRRSDVEQVLRIKHLLFADGLTLAGARRKLEGEPKVEDEPLPDLTVAGDVREKVSRIKQELRGLLDLLSTPPASRQAGAPAEGAASPTPVAATEPDTAAPTASVPAPDTMSSADLPLLDGVTEDRSSREPSKRHRSPRRQTATRNAG